MARTLLYSKWQAQAAHDADADGERSVLVLGEELSSGSEQGKERERERVGGRVMARYPSQRSHYLRVILDAERELARLCGLYEAGVAVDGAVIFRIERVGQEQESADVRKDGCLDDHDRATYPQRSPLTPA